LIKKNNPRLGLVLSNKENLGQGLPPIYEQFYEEEEDEKD